MTTSQLTSPSVALDLLVRDSSVPKVSTVVPLDHGDARRDAIRARSIVDRLAGAAADAPGRPDVEALLRPIPDEISRLHPLDHGITAVALFASPGGRHLIPLRSGTDERIRVGSEYDLLPLLTEIDPPTCHLLTVTRDGARLWRSDPWTIHEVALATAPRSLDDITRHRDLETQLQLHRSGGGTATFHGQGVDEDPDVEPLRTYLRAIDEAVGDVVDRSSALIVMGPGRLPALYRGVSRHTGRLDQVEAHPAGMTIGDLSEVATAVTHEIAAARTARVVETAGNLAGAGRSTDDLATALRHARQGRIDTIAVDTTHPDPDAADVVAETLRHGGSAIPLSGSDRLLMAILRY